MERQTFGKRDNKQALFPLGNNTYMTESIKGKKLNIEKDTSGKLTILPKTLISRMKLIT